MAIERAAEIGCNCVQLFSGSPRVWQKPSLTTVDRVKIDSNSEKYHVSPIFTHALYLVNLASDKPELVEKSIASLEYELQFDARIGGAGVIVHLGSHQGRGFDAMKEQLVDTIATILKKTPDNSTFLIENAAGQNGKIGGKFEEIAYLLTELEREGNWVSKGRVAWCFDTCHGFAAGYALDSVYEEMQQLGLVASLRCIHVNDSRDPFASGRDRHDNLGDGNIPHEALRAFLAEPALAAIPLILEVPGLEKKGPDAENVLRLKKLVGEA
jgi:deoxyribonuclease-4